MVHIDVEMLVAYWINWCAIGVGSSRCLVLIACLTTGHWKNIIMTWPGAGVYLLYKNLGPFPSTTFTIYFFLLFLLVTHKCIACFVPQ